MLCLNEGKNKIMVDDIFVYVDIILRVAHLCGDTIENKIKEVENLIYQKE